MQATITTIKIQNNIFSNQTRKSMTTPKCDSKLE
uniref:Uncharacterized protein n=1 Tax=Rhizophora mucronata TaxID=61149 RepID=A0A2P2P1H3_RHIMU